MKINLTEQVNRHLVRVATEAEINRDRDYRHFHPSEWDDCKRRTAYAFYEARGYISVKTECLQIDPQSQRIFGNGHHLHYRWGSYLESIGGLRGVWRCANFEAHRSNDKIVPYLMGVNEKLGILRPDKCPVCGCERFIYQEVGFHDEETNWGGHVDAVIDIMEFIKYNELKMKVEDDFKFLIVDFKSINYFDFKKLEAPKPEHMTQMQIYLYLSGCKYGKFIYEDKNYQNVKEFLVVRDDKMLAVKKAEAIHLKELITTKSPKGHWRLPPRGYDSKSHTRCRQCKFRGDCWDGRHDKKPAKKEEPNTEPASVAGIGEADV